MFKPLRGYSHEPAFLRMVEYSMFAYPAYHIRAEVLVHLFFLTDDN